MKIDAAMKAMLDSAHARKDGQIIVYNTRDTARCSRLKEVGLAEFRVDAWFLTEKARKILGGKT